MKREQNSPSRRPRAPGRVRLWIGRRRQSRAPPRGGHPERGPPGRRGHPAGSGRRHHGRRSRRGRGRRAAPRGSPDLGRFRPAASGHAALERHPAQRRLGGQPGGVAALLRGQRVGHPEGRRGQRRLRRRRRLSGPGHRGRRDQPHAAARGAPGRRRGRWAGGPRRRDPGRWPPPEDPLGLRRRRGRAGAAHRSAQRGGPPGHRDGAQRAGPEPVDQRALHPGPTRRAPGAAPDAQRRRDRALPRHGERGGGHGGAAHVGALPPPAPDHPGRRAAHRGPRGRRLPGSERRRAAHRRARRPLRPHRRRRPGGAHRAGLQRLRRLPDGRRPHRAPLGERRRRRRELLRVRARGHRGHDVHHRDRRLRRERLRRRGALRGALHRMSEPTRVGVVQMTSNDEVEKNLDRVHANVLEASARGAELIVVPECCDRYRPTAPKNARPTTKYAAPK